MQPAVKRLPAVVAANAVFRCPVEFKIAKRLIVEAANNRVAVGRVELTAQVVFLLGLRARHLPEGVHARVIHPAGKTLAVQRHVGHAEAEGTLNLRIVTAIHLTLRAARAQREVQLTALVKLHSAARLRAFALQPQRQLPEGVARQIITVGQAKQRLRLGFILPVRPRQRNAGQRGGGHKQLIQGFHQPAVRDPLQTLQHRAAVETQRQRQGAIRCGAVKAVAGMDDIRDSHHAFSL